MKAALLKVIKSPAVRKAAVLLVIAALTALGVDLSGIAPGLLVP